MKKRKKWLWIPIVAVILAGAIAALALIPQMKQDPVPVFSFYDGIVGMADYYDGASESSGMVTTDRVQTVYVSSTQTITEICVEEGQQVKKGDVLFTYDTTLSEITLRQKDLQVRQAKLDLETAKRELAIINSYVPIAFKEPDPTEPTEPEETLPELTDEAVEGLDYLVYGGKGDTSLTPKWCWLRSTMMVDETMIATFFTGIEGDVVFVVFQYTMDDLGSGDVTGEYGIKFSRFDDGTGTGAYTYRIGFFDTAALHYEKPEDDGIIWNSGYTAAEIAEMRKDQQQRIKELEFNIKISEAEYAIMQKEADDGAVEAEFDGTVVALTDPETAAEMGLPVLKVSGGGGFYVMGTVSELALETIRIGQTVEVTSWDTWMTYEGTIVEIQDFPVETQDYYYGQSQNVSYYPYKVFIDESADLQDGFYVSMMLVGGAEQTSLYIDNAFLRTEGASSYVYVRGEDGLLEKRQVQVGGSLWGSYTQIRGGITADDWLAFPYGREVKEGAPTVEGTWEDLYG